MKLVTTTAFLSTLGLSLAKTSTTLDRTSGSFLQSITRADSPSDPVKYHSFLLEACLSLSSQYNFECPESHNASVTSDQLQNRKNVPTECDCWSPEYLGTVVNCIQYNHSIDGFVNIQKRASPPRPTFNAAALALSNLVSMCHHYNSVMSLPYLNVVYSNSTPYLVGFTELPSNELSTLYSPITFPEHQIQAKARSVRPKVKFSGFFFGEILLSYFAFFLLCATIVNIIKKAVPQKYLVKLLQAKPIGLFRKHIAYPALVSHRHATPVKKFGSMVHIGLPTRAQTLILLGYYIMFIVFNFVKYDAKSSANLYPDPYYQKLARLIAIRTGQMAISQLPLIFLFAGRNNFMQFLTGWSYDTFMVYHRWVARAMYTCAFIHAVCLTHLYIDVLNEKFAQSAFWRWGAVGVVAGALLLFGSLRIFRVRFYEVFLVCHWLFAIAFTMAVWSHTKNVGKEQWIIASVAVWALDVFLRFVKLILSNVNSTGHATLSPNKSLVKMKITYSNKWHTAPGSHIFLYFKTPWYYSWQSHPFSSYPSPIPGEEDKIVVCFKKYEGITKHIARDLEAAPNHQKKYHIMLEHYGHSFALHSYSSVGIIAGGIGITAVLGYAMKLKSYSRNNPVSFHWVVRDPDDVLFFAAELKSLIISGGMSVYVYITSNRLLRKFNGSNKSNATVVPQNSADQNNNDSNSFSYNSTEPIREIVTTNSIPHSHSHSSSTSETKHDNSTLGYGEEKPEDAYSVSSISSENRVKADIEQITGCTVFYGRPNLTEIVNQQIEVAPSSTGFFVCGAPAMNDAMRKAVSKQMDKCKDGQIGLCLEEYSW